MRFWQQASCAQESNASPVLMPTSTFGTWTTASGHGFFGTMKWARTSGSSSGTASATWTVAHLIPSACYDVSVYVPDTDSDNPGAIYYSNDAHYGVFYPQVNENSYTNQFAQIGTFQANSDGTLPVTLFNNGPSGEYVAADAVAYTLNPNCAAENGGSSVFGGRYSTTILGPGSYPNNFTTSGNWSYDLGHGYANHQLYTSDGSGASAAWTFYGSANACYIASAFIPNNLATNTAASYGFDTQVGVIGTQINQNASTGWTQFQGSPKIPTGSNGIITVTLASTGSSGGSTAADAISFTQVSC
jgi:hypothetical protein